MADLGRRAHERAISESFQDLDDRLGEVATGVMREFHRLLNTTSGVMAAGIVLSEGRHDLTWQMKGALLLFVLSLFLGLLFLYFSYTAHEAHRKKIASFYGDHIEALESADSGPEPLPATKEGFLEETKYLKPVPETLLMRTIRISQIGLVGTGFSFVVWSLLTQI